MKKYPLEILPPHQNVAGVNSMTNVQKREVHKPDTPSTFFWWGGLLVILSIIGLFFFWQFQIKKNPESQFGNKLQTVSLNGHSLSAEVVATQEKKKLGLSGRESLCADCAMLFLYENKGIYSLWMKDMRFNLDIVWLLENEVVYLAKDVPFAGGTAKTINPGILADKVLEINAGASDRLGIKVGDRVSF